MPGQRARRSSPAPAPWPIRRPAPVRALAGLMRAVVAAQYLIAVVSLTLYLVMRDRFTAAVIEMRTTDGAADDQILRLLGASIVAVIGATATLCFEATVDAVLRGGRTAWLVLGVSAALLILLFDWPLAVLATEVGKNAISSLEGYAAWYVPVLYVGVAAHATVVLAGALFSRPLGARVAARRGRPR